MNSNVLPLPQHARKVFEGEIFDVYQWEQPMYDGSVHTFERLKRPDTVSVIPVTEEGMVLLVDEVQPDRVPYVSLPQGRIEAGESPQDAAARELLEETGYAAEELVLVEAFRPVAKIEWTVHVYAGRRCKKVAEPRPDAGEKITVNTVPFERILELVRMGELPGGNELMRAQLDPERMAELKQKLGL